MHNALQPSHYSQEMHSKCQEDPVAMATTRVQPAEPRPGPDGLLRRRAAALSERTRGSRASGALAVGPHGVKDVALTP